MPYRDMAKATDKALGEISEVIHQFLEDDADPHETLRKVSRIADAGLDEDFIPEGEEPAQEDEDDDVAGFPPHAFVTPNNARPTLCDFMQPEGVIRCLMPRGHWIHTA